ncbi:VWA domain-containing protein [Carboxylicivirga taeanensis]|uniref:VWA domain-containing protein n=1 Tax=Carboxylicivirga taeanensis TaxID=1416875 RepID=UPI003F6E1638
MTEPIKLILQQFHFIHPQWLWALLPVLCILLLIFWSNRESKKWERFIAPHLRPVLFMKGSQTAFWWPLIAYWLACSFIILSLAGPTWKMKDIPQGKAAAVLLIGVDLSHSMLATDIAPNRLERAKMKITDLLNANPETDIGLFVYSGTPHIAVPFCSDYSIITHHIENLHPSMMPVRGTNMQLAISLADSLLQPYDAPGTLLLITDNLSLNDAALVKSFCNNSIHQVTIMPLASISGGTMPAFNNPNKILKDKEGRDRIATIDMSVIQNLKQTSKVSIIPPTLDQSDIENIATEVRKRKLFTLGDKHDDEQWDNKGWWLILPALLIVLAWFRKGWSIFWLWTGILIHACSPIDKNASLWYTDDYRAQQMLKDSLYEEAANTFTSIPHKGLAYYKAGNYDAALELFSLDSTANGRYNKGVTLIQLGRLEEAQNCFEQLLKLAPEMQAAKQNLERTQRLILERDSIGEQMNETIHLDKKEKTDEPLQERSAKTKDEELTSDTEVDELPDDGKRVSDEVATEISKAEEMEKPDDAMNQEGEQKDAKNIMFKKISADPSEFLRRRFKFQKDKHYPNEKELSDI